MRSLIALAALLFSSPAYAIDASCTTTDNLGIFRCPEGSQDWYESYTGIVDNLDSLARTAPSSFTVRQAFEAGGLFYVEDGGQVGIGTSDPAESLGIVEDDGENAVIRLTDFDTFPVPAVIFRSVEGTQASSSTVVTNDFTGLLGFSGWNGVQFPAVAPAAVAGRATENWTASAQGSRLELGTTANGATTRTERMRIDQNGNVGIGATNPAELLDVRGNIVSNASVTASGFFGDGSGLTNVTATPSNTVSTSTLYGGFSTTDSSFNGCVAGSTVTLTATNQRLLVTHTGSFSCSTSGGCKLLETILIDGDFPTGYDAAGPIAAPRSSGGGFDQSVSFTFLTEQLNGSVDICLAVWGSSGGTIDMPGVEAAGGDVDRNQFSVRSH